MQNHNDTIIKTSEEFFQKIYLSLYCKVCVWEGVGDRTELQHIDPHSYGHQRCVFLVLLMLNRRPGGSAFCWALAFSITSCYQRVSKLTGYPEVSFCRVVAFLRHLVSNSSDLQLIDFLFSPSYIVLQSPTQSLERHVWSSSSGNNCHAVHRSLSSGASVYACTMGFHLVPYCQPSPPTRFLLITAIGMCHFLPVHHFGMACLARSKVNIQQFAKQKYVTLFTFKLKYSYRYKNINRHFCLENIYILKYIIRKYWNLNLNRLSCISLWQI